MSKGERFIGCRIVICFERENIGMFLRGVMVTGGA
jgi:hypothetical protein